MRYSVPESKSAARDEGIRQFVKTWYRSSDMKSYVAKSWMDWLVWLLGIGAIAFHSSGVLAARVPAGWDLTGHFYLFTKFVSDFPQSLSFSYSTDWFAGYDLFRLYPWLPYAVPAALYWGSFGLLPMALCFNIVVFLLPLLLLVGMGMAAHILFGRRAGSFAVLLTAAALCHAAPASYARMSLSGIFHIGYYGNYLALPLLPLLIVALYRSDGKSRLVTAVTPGVLLGLIANLHLIIGLFSTLYVVGWGLLGLATRLRTLLAIGFIAVVMALPLWSSVVTEFPSGSGEPMGISKTIGDPLHILLPDLSPDRIASAVDLLSSVSCSHCSFAAQLFSKSVALKHVVGIVPWSGILLLMGTLAGVRLLWTQRKYDLLVIFFVLLLLLPRDLWIDLVPLPIHYSRFIQPLMMLQILIAAGGLSAMFSTRARRATIVLMVITALTVHAASRFDLAVRSSLEGRDGAPYYFFIDQYPEYKDAHALVEYLQRHHPDARIVEEKPITTSERLGTHHFFATQLPLNSSIEVLNGMLIESSLTAGFVDPVMAHLTATMPWGRRTLLKNRQFLEQSMDDMIERLQLFDVNFLITVTPRSAAKLRRLLHEEVSFGSFTLFRLSDARAPVQELSSAPILFVDEGGINFRQFSEIWYLWPTLFRTPVFFQPQGLDEISAEELSRFGGYILSVESVLSLDDSTFKRWRNYGKPIIVIASNLAGQPAVDPQDNIVIINDVSSYDGAYRLQQQLLQFSVSPNSLPLRQWLPREPLSITTQSAAIVRYSYSAQLAAINESVPLYMVTPSFVGILGNGVERRIER